MRSAEQVGRTVGQWHDYQRAERAKRLRELLSMLRRARDEDAEWYRWVLANRDARASARASPER